MRTWLPGLILPTLALWAAPRVAAAPSAGTPVVVPSTVVVGHSTPVTATCQVTTTQGDPALLAGGVNLVRLTSTGADFEVVGVMTAGSNGAYSYSFADTETAAGQYELQCTAAFTETIDRVRSTAATVTVTSTSPTLTSLSTAPASPVASQQFTLTVSGSNFNPATAFVTVNGPGCTPCSIANSALTSKTAASLAGPVTLGSGAFTVAVQDGAGGPVSGTLPLSIGAAGGPIITSIAPRSGKQGATVTVTVAGLDLLGATFALKSVDPADANAGAGITVASNTGTLATLTVALGTTEGQFALTGTTTAGTSVITPAALFLIGPTTNSVSFYASVLNTGFNAAVVQPLSKGQNAASFYTSVLNTGFNAAVVQPLSKGQNAASFYASVLNTGFNSTNIPALPKGQNAASFYASVLNTGFNSTNIPALPKGQNAASFYTSVLNTGFNATGIPALPKGQNAASFYTSVLNTGFNATDIPALPTGQNSVSYYISVCNTSSGCTAVPAARVSVNASPVSTRPRSAAAPHGSPLPGAPSRDALPFVEPLDEIASVTVGQTIRLGARNVDPGSIVEFDVNQAVIAKVAEAPYETLFTVPDGPSDLAFQIVVQAPGQPERLSQIVRMTVVPDAGASIAGNLAQGTGGLELSLAAGGLKAEFFHLAQPVTGLPSLDAVKPVRTGYVTAIDQPNPGAVFGDDPLGAHLGTDYAIRFTGEVRAEAAGEYRFWITARSGAALLIDGKPLADTGLVTGDPVEAPVLLALNAGWHSIEVIYYLAVGVPSVRLDWQPPISARREVLGPEHLRTDLAGMAAVSAADGTFAFTGVPAKFDTVWIRVKHGTGFLEFPAVKPGSGPVSLAVPK